MTDPTTRKETPMHPLIATVNERFGGVLSTGSHDPNGHACIREAASVARGREWSDGDTSGLPDIRPLNDARWSSDALRTEHMLRLGVALWDWEDWTPERRQAWAEKVAIGTVNRILPYALRAAGVDATACEAATTLDEAEAAAWAAWAAAAARAARWAAWAAADSAMSAEEAATSAAWAWAARSAAWAAADSAMSAEEAAAWAEDTILIAAVDLWTEAAA